MIQSYNQNPTFGDSKQFQEELESTILKVQKLESELHSQNVILNDLNYKLEQKKSIRKSPLLLPQTIPKMISYSPEGSRSSSAGYGTISNYSNSDIESDSSDI